MGDRPLGDVLTLARDPVVLEDDQEYATVGIYSYGRGLFERPVVTGRETSYSTYYKLHVGQFVYSKLFAWEGALAIVDERYAGMYVSQEFPTFTIEPTIAIPEYVALLCSWPETWARVRTGETGMGGRRKRVHPERLLEIELPFPPLQEQRRIVDLVEALDNFIAAARGLDLSASQAYYASLSGLDISAPLTRLSSVVVWARAGGTPSRDMPQYFRGDIPWLKSGEVANDCITTTEETITEAGLANSSAWLVPADSIVVAMYGATAGVVGYLAAPMATNQAVLALCADPSRVDQRFLFHWLRGRSEAMKSRASGAAQPNLSKQRVLEEGIPLMPLDWQKQVVGYLDAILDMERRAHTLARAGGLVRSSLLSDLLPSVHEIPATYDTLLGTA
jgi:type I restriction enzyme S subunit